MLWNPSISQKDLFHSTVRLFLFLSALFLLLYPFSFVRAAAAFTGDVIAGTYSDNAIETTHFHFEFNDDLKNDTDSDDNDVADVIDRIAGFAEESWDQEVTEMDYAVPVDTSAGEKVLVFLDDERTYLVPGALGVSSVLSDGETIYMAVDPSLEDNLLDVTVAHEFFHVITFGYAVDFAQSYQDLSFAEASAVWIEDEVFDDSDSYVDYLPYFFSESDYSLFAGILPANSLYEYGLVIWPRFLSENFGTDIMKTTWEEFFALDNDGLANVYNVYNAFQASIEAEGVDFVDVFQDFRSWNYDVSQYAEGSVYPKVTITASHSTYPVSKTSVNSNNWPALFGTNYVQFVVDSATDGDFEFVLSKSSDVTFAVRLLPVDSDGVVHFDAAVDAEYLMGTSGGSVVLSDGSTYTKIIAVVSPVGMDFESVTSPQDAFDQGYQYFYSAEFGDFVSSTIEDATDDTEADTESGLPVVEDVSIVNLIDAGVIVGWDRIVNDTVAGYRVYYGVASGSYDTSVDTTATRKTVSGLTPDQVYYFAVKAVDADGNESPDFSTEVSTTVYEQLFSDVAVNSAYDTAIRYLVSIGVLEGYSDGTFLPDATVNRAELLKIILEAKGITPDTGRYANCFPDVTTEWYAPYVCYAAHVDWIQGYDDGFFRPANTVNKAEALKMVLNAFNFAVSDPPVQTSFSDVDVTEWYAPYVAVADGFGLLEESGTFDGAEGRTRAEIAEEVFRTLVVLAFDGEVFSEDLVGDFL